MSVTLKDVANLAGVNIAAVSRTLRNDPRALELREETRTRIRKCAKQLGYHCNRSASAMRMGYNPSTIALIYTPDVYGHQSCLFKIISIANSHGLGVHSCSDADLSALFGELESNQFRYVICISKDLEIRERIAKFCAASGRFLVFFGAGRPKAPHTLVRMDYRKATVDMVRYFASLGHTRIGFYCGVHRHSSTELLHQGFADGAAACPGVKGYILCEEYSQEALFGFLKKNPVTALGTIDNSVGIRVENDLYRAGIRVPDDISVATIGGGQINRLALSPLTCFGEPVAEMAEAALKHLLENRKAQDRREILVPGEFCVLESCIRYQKNKRKERKG